MLDEHKINNINLEHDSIKGYYTITSFDINDVLSGVGTGRVFNYNGYKFKLDDVRYKVFKEKGLYCKCCRKQGVIALLQYNITHKVHINFYHITEHNTLKLMTIDHTVPDSLGGTTTVANLEPMCSKCNNRKGAKVTESDLRDYHIRLYMANNRKFNKDKFEGYFNPIVHKRNRILHVGG